MGTQAMKKVGRLVDHKEGVQRLDIAACFAFVAACTYTTLLFSCLQYFHKNGVYYELYYDDGVVCIYVTSHLG